MSLRRRPLSDAPLRLSPAQREGVRAWCRAHHPRLEAGLGRHWAECRDWHLSHGILRADWAATLRSWLRKAAQFQARDETWREPRRPVLGHSREGTPSRLGPELRMVQGGLTSPRHEE